ncbi:MAG: SAM-dependent methyltransferase, partial [Pseudomonadota bacterium]
ETVYEIEGESPISSRSTLRFAGADHLVAAAKAAGLTLRHAHGDWDGSPLSERSPEIILGFGR